MLEASDRQEWRDVIRQEDSLLCIDKVITGFKITLDCTQYMSIAISILTR